MKSILIVAGLIFLSFTNCAIAQNWKVSTPYNGRYNDLVFTDSKTGYACGQGAGIGLCTGTGLINKTIDGGTTWTRMYTGTVYELNRLFFLDAFTGWTLGSSNTVLKTSDGGVSWTLQPTGVGTDLNDIYFANSNTGFLCGDGGVLRKTVNGGSLFSFAASGVTTDLYALHFVNASIGFLVGNSGVIRKTVNGGTSFSSVYSGAEHFRDVYFMDADTGFVMSSNKILKTTNGGSNWSVYSAAPGSVLTRMHFVTARIGFVGGDSGLLLKTTDGGATWNTIVSNTSDFLRCVFFTDENTGYYGLDLGRIHKTNDGGASWNSILSGLSEEMFSVHFRNRSLGIATGRYGGIYRTENGGLNWTYRNEQAFPSLNCVRWLTDDKVIAAGGNGTLLKSEDAGIHWHQLNTGVNDNMDDIHVLDSSRIFITFGTGKLMKSSDGGATWDTTLNTTSNFPLTGVYFLNQDTGYVCAANEVYRTYNGGAAWALKNDSVSMNAGFSDIFFPGRDTGYVGGGFGKLYRTINGGQWWQALYPGGVGNAEINEMQFTDNTTGYFAGLTSQRFTNNGGTNLSTMPTACLANNWSTHSIHLPVKDYGYCVGGMSGLLHTLQKDSIFSTYLQDSIFCSGSKIVVGYEATGLLLSTQVLDVQLSDANGSFASPTIIGTFPLVIPMTHPSGIATCTLPPGLNGTGYRIRVVCNSPVLTGTDNGFDLTIQTSTMSDVNISLLSDRTCVGEALQFYAQPIAGGSNPEYTWRLDNQLLEWQAATITIDSLQGIHSLHVEMNSSLSCAGNAPSDSIQFEVFQNPPQVDAGTDQAICNGESVIIGTMNNTGPLSWTPSSSLDDDTVALPVATPVATQNYILTTNNTDGCFSHDTVRVWVNQLPAIAITGSLQVCSGDSTLLIANTSVAHPRITWSPSNILSADTGSQVYVMPLNHATVYAVLVDDSSCVNTDSVSISLVPAAALPVLTILNNNLVVTINTANLEWYRNNILISGFNNDTLYNAAAGTYFVNATDSNGCSASSQSVLFSTVGIIEQGNSDVSAYFTKGILQVKVTGATSQNSEITLIDVRGRAVVRKTIQLNSAGMGELEINNISNGMYFSRIRAGRFERTMKIIVE